MIKKYELDAIDNTSMINFGATVSGDRIFFQSTTQFRNSSISNDQLQISKFLRSSLSIIPESTFGQ